MRLKINKDNYITGYGCFGNPEYPEYTWKDAPEDLTDNHGNYLYKYSVKDGNKTVTDMEGKETEEPTKIITVTYDPQPLTAEQKEKDREQLIESKIPYTIGQELALINKGIKDSKNLEYLEYRATVEKIKGETK